MFHRCGNLIPNETSCSVVQCRLAASSTCRVATARGIAMMSLESNEKLEDGATIASAEPPIEVRALEGWC